MASLLLIAPVLLLMGCASRQQLTPASLPGSALSSPAHFDDVTARAGITFRHDNGAAGRKYLPETMGSGCAFFDYDGDGFLDILLLNQRPLDSGKSGSPAHPSCALYHNNGNGTFTDVTKDSGLDVPMTAMGVAVGDYDNDGSPDLYITTVLGPNRLFRNRGRQASPAAGAGAHSPLFEEVATRAGVGDRRWGSSAAWVDYDNDGYLDLFVCCYVRYRSLADEKGCTTGTGRRAYCPPDMYEGESCILYHNNGDGTFTDVSRETGIAKAVGMALGVTLLDYDADGWPDIAVANDTRPNFLFHNVPASSGVPGRRAFKEIALEAGLALDAQGAPKAGMGIDTADCNNDGKLCVAVSNFSNEGLSLFQQERPGLFVDIGAQAGLTQPSYLMVGFGLLFADFDNDGRLDLLSVNGHVFPDSDLPSKTVTYQQPTLLFHNEGGGVFREIGASCGEPFAQRHVGRGTAVGDYDNDGRLDILIVNNNEAPELLHNDSAQPGNWLQIEVRGAMRPGIKPHGARGPSNRDAVGAKVTVRAGGQTLTQWSRSGSSYLSDSMRRLHFGLGRASEAETIDVRFPGGATVRRANVKANQRLLIEEP